MLAWKRVPIRGALDKKAYEKYLHEEVWGLLKSMLKEAYGINLGDEEVIRNYYGKPYLKHYPDLYFNLSHCEGMTACIISRHEAGLDLEKIRPLSKSVLRRAFSEEEKAFLSKIRSFAEENESKGAGSTLQAEAESRTLVDEYFFRIWTLKESYIKAIGMGLGFPLKEISLMLTEKGWISQKAQGYEFKQLKLKGGFILSWCENKEEK